MAQNPDLPKDNGEIKLPPVDAGMVKIPPAKSAKPKKRTKRRRMKDVRDATSVPALSENTDDMVEEQNEEESNIDEKGKKTADTPDEISDDESDEDILKRMRKRFDRSASWEAVNRKAELEDLKFKAGDQWPADVATQRNTDRRPCMTVNRIPTLVHQVTNQLRENRPSIDVSPMGDRGDPDAAKLYRGMIRGIERESAADIAYDTASDSAVSIGEGFFRILTEYESTESFYQRIAIQRIRNRFTVYMDPGTQEPDGADARWGFVTDLIPRDQYELEYPDADPMPWAPQGVGEGYKDWIGKDEVRVAEYFEIKLTKKTLVELENGWTGYKDDLSDDVKDKIKSKRILIDQERDVEVPVWHWYKATGKEILDRNIWPGKWLPIIRVIGDEIDIEGKVGYFGLIRNAKDPQRIKNYSVTAQIETVALQPKAPYIMAEGQAEGHEQQWKQANTVNYPVLYYKPDTVGGKAVPPPQRNAPPPPSQGWEVLRQMSEQDLMATTGVRFDANQSENRVDDSGRAIRELRRSSDIGNFHFADNLARAMKNLGMQLIDLIPKIYDGKRMATILREDDTEEMIRIDPNAHAAYSEMKDPKTGKTIKTLNPTMGKYACTVTVGPSYATKRIEAAESMMQFAKALPQTAALISDLIAQNQDWPGAEVIAARLAKTIPANLLTPESKDMTPQIQAVIQSLEQQVQQLGQQLQGAMAALNDKDKDRALVQSKIESDFEYRILQVIQKAEESVQKHIGSHIQNLASDTRALATELEATRIEHQKPKAAE